MTKEEIRAAIERLKAVDFKDTNSYDRLARICNAFYSPKCGWTLGACAGLRQTLIDLLEQFTVADSAYSDGIRDGMEQALKGLANDELAKYGLMRLPKDADGEYVHIGDLMVCMSGIYEGVHATVWRIAYGEMNGHVYEWMDGNHSWHTCENWRHDHKLTVEDVLLEMCNEVWEASLVSQATWSDSGLDGIESRYAEKLREVMADE